MNTEAKNKIFDIILTEALKEHMDLELKQLNESAETEPHEFSAKFERKMKRIQNSIGRTDRIKKFGRAIFKAAVSAAAVFAITFGMLLTQPRVSAAVQSTIRRVFDKYDRLEYIGDESAYGILDNNIKLGYVPEGYRWTEGKCSPSYAMLTYVNENTDETLEFNYSIANGFSLSCDNEYHMYKEFVAYGRGYSYYESNDSKLKNTLLWFEDGYAFSLSAHLSKDELIEIAENLER